MCKAASLAASEYAAPKNTELIDIIFGNVY